jgi:phosphoribosylglycinamide formyltransferase 1
MNSTQPRLVVLISAGGTTLQNLINQIHDGRFTAEIVGVIASRADIFGLERAKRANLPSFVVERKGKDFSARVFEKVRELAPDWVILAGWLHLIQIPDDFTNRVLNIHPSLLPAFGGHGMYGHHVHEAVLASGVKLTGCTVHFADNSYDTGPIVVQRSVPVLEADTAETLAARVYEAECVAYPEAIRLLSRREWRVEGRRVLGLQ